MQNNRVDMFIRRGIRQHDIRDCGAACLATILLYNGLSVPLVTIREKLKVDKNGSNFYAIKTVAKEYRLDSEALKGSWDELFTENEKKRIVFPFIANIITEESLSHFIIIKRIKKTHLSTFDPAKGHQNISIDEFKRCWTGYILQFKKENDFDKGKTNKKRFKKYYTILTSQKSSFVCAILVSLILAFISIITSLIYQHIIDYYVLENTEDIINIDNLPVFSHLVAEIKNLSINIDYLFLSIIIIYLIHFLLYLVRGVIVSLISKRSNDILMKNYFEHLLKLPLGYFSDRETGEIMSRFQNIDEIQDILSGICLILILESGMAVAGGIVLFNISIELFSIVIVVALIYSIIVLIFKKPIARNNREVMENEAILTAALKETIDGIETIKSVNGENKINQKLKSMTNMFIKKLYKGNIIGISQSAMLIIIEGIGMIIILWSGCLLVMNNSISLGSLIAFETLVFTFLGPIQSLVNIQHEFQAAYVAMDRLDDIMEIKPENNKSTNSTINKHLFDKSIELVHVSFAYGFRDDILCSLDLTIPSGEKIAIVGKSGCGKSTLLKLLATHYNPTSGSIRIGGQNISDIPLKHLRQRISYVPQNSVIFSGTIKENLLYSIDDIDEEYFEKVVKGCDLKILIDSLPFGLNTRISENGKDLSGGQRQKISIARSLMLKPEILLLDEATSNLDEKSELRIMTFLEELLSKNSIIHVTHKENILAKYDKIILMKDGKIICQGKHIDLLKKDSEYADHFKNFK